MKYIIAICFLCLFSCTENSRARHFGGTETINLPSGQKLVNATWRETGLWYLTRPMKADERPETLNFREKSSFGMVEGTVVFIETR